MWWAATGLYVSHNNHHMSPSPTPSGFCHSASSWQSYLSKTVHKGSFEGRAKNLHNVFTRDRMTQNVPVHSVLTSGKYLAAIYTNCGLRYFRVAQFSRIFILRPFAVFLNSRIHEWILATHLSALGQGTHCH